MAAYWGILILRFLFGLLPAGLARGAGAILGRAAYRLDARHRRIALENLQNALGEGRGLTPELKKIARASFAFMGANLAAALRIGALIRSPRPDLFRIEGEEHLASARRAGKGMILVLAHLDNWEYLSLLAPRLNFRSAAIAQEVKNPALDGLIRDTRAAAGLELFEKHEVTGAVLDFLAAGGAVAVLADQRPRAMAVEVPFFGIPTATTAAPAVLAARSGAVLLPVFIETGPDCFRVVFEPPVPLPEEQPVKGKVLSATARLNQVIEERIRRSPERWLWAHRRWKIREAGA